MRKHKSDILEGFQESYYYGSSHYDVLNNLTTTTGDDIVNAGFLITNINGNIGTDHLILDYSGALSGVNAASTLTSNQIFAQQGKLVTFAKLASAAYYEIGETSGLGAYNWITETAGLSFDVLTTIGLQNSATIGLYTAFGSDIEVLVAESSNGIFISFRGTEPSFSGTIDWVTNFNLILGQSTIEYVLLEPLFNAIFDYAVSSGKQTIHIAGHSQGAGLAEIFMDDYVDGYRGMTFEAYVFSSPGLSGLDGIFGTDGRINTYSHNLDAINLAELFLGSSGNEIRFKSVSALTHASPVGLHSMDTLVDVVTYLRSAGLHETEINFSIEPPRVCRRLFSLSYAAFGTLSTFA